MDAQLASAIRLRRIGSVLLVGAMIAPVLQLVVFFGLMRLGVEMDFMRTWFGIGFVLMTFAPLGWIFVARARSTLRNLGVDAGGTGASAVLTVFAGIGLVCTIGLTAVGALLGVIGAGLGRIHGRPLRMGRRQVLPQVRPSVAWAEGPRPDISELNDATREALAESWLQDAKAEHASVPAFARIAWQLAALGAPPGLLARANQSALEEIDHAQRAFALASTYARNPLGPMPMPELAAGMGKLPRDRVRVLAAVASESLVDGAFLESYSAALARVGLDDVVDPAAREMLERIAIDEAAHAELAWDILAFCIDEGGAPVVRALVRAVKTIGIDPPAPYPRETLALVAGADHSALRAHGRVRPDAWAPAYATCRANTLERLETMLSGKANMDINDSSNSRRVCRSRLGRPEHSFPGRPF